MSDQSKNSLIPADADKRETLVKFLGDQIGRVEQDEDPFVMAIDSPWGTGKTVFVGLLKEYLEAEGQDFTCIYFNAWECDYTTDPLVAMVAEMGPALGNAKMRGVKKYASLIAKEAARHTVREVIAWAVPRGKDIADIVEKAIAKKGDNLVTAFTKERGFLEKFRKQLGDAVNQLPKAKKKSKLVFFIDELDRCRPTFAIELLERVKHIFDIPNIIFVLSLDKQQLAASVKSVYGKGTKAEGYLHRFFNLEYRLPDLTSWAFTDMLMKRFKLDEEFKNRVREKHEKVRSAFCNMFTHLAGIFKLSPREQERCMARLQAVICQTKPVAEQVQTRRIEYFAPVLVAILIVLHLKEREIFYKWVNGEVFADDVWQTICNLPNYENYLAKVEERERVPPTYVSAMLHLQLFDAEPDLNYAEKRIRDLHNEKKTTSDQNWKLHLEAFFSVSNHLYARPYMANGGYLKRIAKKIDLASGIQ